MIEQSYNVVEEVIDVINERQKIILKELNKNGSVNVNELVSLLNTSESSVRRDLVELDSLGLLKRVHGGATLIPHTTSIGEDPLSKRQHVNQLEKQRIGAYAATFVEAQDLIYIDSGSSTLELIQALTEKDAVYVTNGLMQAQHLALKGFRVICLGGEVRSMTDACVGGEVIKALQKYQFSKGFFGANGVDLEGGFTTPDSEEASVKNYAMSRCHIKYVLCDHSKFNKVYPVRFGDVDEAIIISDYCSEEIRKLKNSVEVDYDIYNNL